MTVRRLFALLAVLGLLFAACGDDGGIVESANESSNDDSSDDFDPSDIDLEDLDDAQDAIDAFLPEGCEFFIDFALAVSLAIGGQGDLSAVSVGDAPAEIQDDVATVLGAIEGSSGDAGGLATVFTDPDIEEALDNIDAFSTANCQPLADG